MVSVGNDRAYKNLDALFEALARPAPGPGDAAGETTRTQVWLLPLARRVCALVSEHRYYISRWLEST